MIFAVKLLLISAASVVSVSGRGIKRRFRGRRVCSWKTLMKRPILVAIYADAKTKKIILEVGVWSIVVFGVERSGKS